jgi:mono/diheme cytochrome c family protein
MQRVLITLCIFTLLAAGSLALAEGAVKPDAARGKEVYLIYCLACHGPNYDGKGPVGVALPVPPRDFTLGEFKYGATDQDIFDTITNGAASKGASPLMAPWGAVISETDRWAVLKFIRSVKK